MSPYVRSGPHLLEPARSPRSPRPRRLREFPEPVLLDMVVLENIVQVVQVDDGVKMDFWIFGCC